MSSRRRRVRALTPGLAFAQLAIGATLAVAQVPAGERIPIRDPDRLEAMGLPRDAANVAVWSKAGFGAQGGRAVPAAGAPETWGTAAGSSTAFGHQLKTDYSDLIRSVGRTSCSSGAGGIARDGYFRLRAPDGAQLKQLMLWAYDSSDTRDLEVQLYETCQADGVHSPTVTLVDQVSTVLAIGEYFGSTGLNDLTIDNRNCGYAIRVRFAALNQACLPDDLALEKVQVLWTRQVSPAPATASFTDVPTSHPFFPYVEALVKSGVTGGCGGGNYCPDSALTRGQMAVFLAKALGLEWP